MKKLNKFRIASFLASFALMITTYSKLPDSLFLWGEPTLPLDELDK